MRTFDVIRAPDHNLTIIEKRDGEEIYKMDDAGFNAWLDHTRSNGHKVNVTFAFEGSEFLVGRV